MNTLALLQSDVLAVVDPGQGVQPPGTEGVITLISWVAWIVFAACVIGILIVAGKMALAHRRGEGAESAGQLGLVLGSVVLAGAASALVGAIAG